MGMMLELSPSIDEELDDGFVEREDTHVMLSGEMMMKAVAVRANISRHLR